MIIDSHCHAGAGFGLTDPWTKRPLLEKYLRRSAAAGITHSVLFANFHDDYAVANRIVARIVNRYPERFYGFAYAHALRDRGRIHAMVRIAVKDYGFVGIKAHRHDARISREICEVARNFGLAGWRDCARLNADPDTKELRRMSTIWLTNCCRDSTPVLPLLCAEPRHRATL